MMSQTLEIFDNNFLILFKDDKLSIKENKIIDFVSPIKLELSSSLSIREFSNLIDILRNLFKIINQEKYTYCIKLDSSYDQIEFNCHHFKNKLSSLLHYIIEEPKQSKKLSARFLEVLDENKDAVNYFTTFQTLSRDDKNLLISNRNRGWIKKGWNQFGKKLQITENLQGDVYANFGYGKSSYLYILITYKGIPITTFTDYIRYEFIRAGEVVRYTRKFYHPFYEYDEFGNVTKTISLKYEEWTNLMSYVISLANIPDCDSELFFQNYINREFRTMVHELEGMHESENYIFYKNTENENGNIIEEPYTVGLKERLLSYKTEKIFGTLIFFKTLNKLFLSENKDSVDKLLDLYKKQFPNLEKERLEIMGKIPFYEENLIEEEEHLKTYLADKLTVKILRKIAQKQEEVSAEEQKIYKEYLAKKNTISIVDDGINNLKATIKRIEKYKKDYLEICETFNSKISRI